MEARNIIEMAGAALAAMNLDIDMPGGGAWAPSRSPKKDYSKWGVWEAWPFCRFGKINECLVGPIPTGGWVMWNSETGSMIGFEDKSVISAQRQAEIACVSQNRGKPTRVVDLDGNYEASKVRLSDVERMLGPALAEFDEAQRAQAEAAAENMTNGQS